MFIVGCFVVIFVIDADKKEPQISPDGAKKIDSVATLDSAEKGCDHHERHDKEHSGYKYNQGIDRIKEPGYFQNRL